MKLNSCIYLFAQHSQFNPEIASLFESFDQAHSSALYYALNKNYFEVFNKLKYRYPLVYIFDSNDKNFLPEQILNANRNIMFYEPGNKTKLIKILSERYFTEFANNLIIFSSSIGISAKDIVKIFDLLSIDDEAVVLGKAFNERISYFGFNTYRSDLFDSIDFKNFGYENFLMSACAFENFIYVLGGSMNIINLNDFANLYKELSKKESYSYCSEHIHERFTNLFIEYKELL